MTKKEEEMTDIVNSDYTVPLKHNATDVMVEAASFRKKKKIIKKLK